MKNWLFIVVTLTSSLMVLGAPREIEIKTEKINEAVHWVPEKVEVAPGEEIKFIIKHDLEGGFDFHGFFVPQLKIQKQVNRHKAEEMTVMIPKDMKPGEYPIGCHFHPKHVAATLVVKKIEKKP
jgi:plastocyanin